MVLVLEKICFHVNRTSMPVRSFDLFDTLVARRCVDPHAVFHLLEHRAGLKNLATARIAAEQSIAGSPHDLAAIYRTLCERHNLPLETGQKLLNLEIAIEAEMLFPIAETCALFQPGDIVVSDMYLPEPFLTRLLRETCQLDPARLYLSSNGKRSGAVWAEIAKDYTVTTHFGDNEVTDIQSAEAAGITPRHVTLASRSPVEALLHANGLAPLSNIIREARLRTTHKLPALRQLQILQIQLNFPLLFLASLNLAAQAAQRGWQKILFSGRDGYLWHSLYQSLYPLLEHAPPSVYFYTSRIARMRPSPGYLAYFDALRGPAPSVVVDVIGTGWSLTRLIDHAGPAKSDIFLIHQLEEAALTERYQSFAPTRAPVTPIALLRRPASRGDNEVLEELNRAPHPMVTDMADTPTGLRPVLAPADLTPATREILHIHHEAFGAATRLVPSLSAAELRQMQDFATPAFIAGFYGNFGGHLPALSHFRPNKIAEENMFFAALQAPGQ